MRSILSGYVMTFRNQGYFKDILRIFQGYYLKHDEITHQTKNVKIEKIEKEFWKWHPVQKWTGGRFLGSTSYKVKILK